MRKQNQQHDFNTIGFSSILVVFVMLALATFTVLTLVSANADYKLTTVVAERNTAYQTAGNEATKKVAAIDEHLSQLYQTYGNITLDALESSFADSSYTLVTADGDMVPFSENGLTLTKTDSGILVSFSESINKRQDLLVELLVYEQPTTCFYEVNTWKVTAKETADDSISLEEDGLHLLH